MKIVIVLFAVFCCIAADDGHQHHHYYGAVNHHHERGASHEDTDSDDKTYVFAIGDDYGAFEFEDDEGHLKGFHIDLMFAVCKRIGVDCYWVLDQYKNCWQTTGDREFPGEGLLSGWYTACIGYWPYPRRYSSFNFTESFVKPDAANVFWLKSNDGKYKTDNVTGLKVGFISGWVTSKFCLARETGNSITDFEAVSFDDHSTVLEALRAGKVDVMVNSANSFNVPDDLSTGDSFTCNWNQKGSAFMLRVGDPAVNAINDALYEMYSDGSYKKLCNHAKRIYAHKGVINCLD